MPQFKDGLLRNDYIHQTITDGVGFWDFIQLYWNKPKTDPGTVIPTVTTNLNSLDATGNTPKMVWFGHSSYLIVYKGMKILVDPVLSGNASPLPFMVKTYPYSYAYTAADMPKVDIILISHDHYDHLDYATVSEMKSKTTLWLTSLGAGAHLEKWGIEPNKIVEMAWWESHVVGEAMFTATPAQHFSGRLFTQGKTLWSGFALDFKDVKMYLGGDSGYNVHFKEIGSRLGPFDLAFIENGQYHEFWKNIHLLPSQVPLAAEDLQALYVWPVHWGKFTLSVHPWNAPIQEFVKNSASKSYRTITPHIGEVVDFRKDSTYTWEAWWEGL